MEWQAKQDRQGKIMQQLDVHIIEIGFYRFYSDLKVANSHRTGFAILALLEPGALLVNVSMTTW